MMGFDRAEMGRKLGRNCKWNGVVTDGVEGGKLGFFGNGVKWCPGGDGNRGLLLCRSRRRGMMMLWVRRCGHLIFQKIK